MFAVLTAVRAEAEPGFAYSVGHQPLVYTHPQPVYIHPQQFVYNHPQQQVVYAQPQPVVYHAPINNCHNEMGKLVPCAHSSGFAPSNYAFNDAPHGYLQTGVHVAEPAAPADEEQVVSVEKREAEAEPEAEAEAESYYALYGHNRYYGNAWNGFYGHGSYYGNNLGYYGNNLGYYGRHLGGYYGSHLGGYYGGYHGYGGCRNGYGGLVPCA